ncbi:deoxyribose-phosphate aldolase [bacterium]|nr:MAG: deoxyribose-phosphate aldolase [bacterium]
MKSKDEMAGKIESTLLRADASRLEVEMLCAEAVRLGLFGVCVAPSRILDAKEHLTGSGVKVVTVIGFPLGNTTSNAKLAEVEDALALGADELDIVMNIGHFLDGRFADVERELQRAKNAVGDKVLKVILETGYLGEGQIIHAGRLALEAGADFLKTSTGFGPRGASVEDVRLLSSVAGEKAGVKASGGIKTMARAIEMIGAGATRIGTSSAGAIMLELG